MTKATHWCFGYCWAYFLFFPLCPPQLICQGSAQSCMGTQPGQLIQTDQGDIPCYVNSLLNKENWGRRIWGEIVIVIGQSLAVQQCTSGRWRVTAFPITSGFFPSSFLHSFKFLSQTMSLLTFALPTLFLVPLAGDISKQLWWGQAITKGEKKKKVRKNGSGPIYPSELCLF